MANIEMTDAERLILANQYEILSLLQNNDAELALLSRHLRNGHVALYQDRLHISPALDAATEQHVFDILAVYGALKDSYEGLADKTGIDSKDVVFGGFDGNNEGEMLRYARALVEEDRWINVLGADPQGVRNSHGQTEDTYRRMVGAWKKLGTPHVLTKEQILTVLGARRYASTD